MTQFDAFLCETLLAIGPAAKVFRGVDVITGRKVRIKVLLEDETATHPLDRERLQLLVPALLQVRHPQVSGFITLLPAEDDFALVHEFIPGVSALRFPHERKLARTDLLALAVQLLQAVQLGELARFPHGDLKPSNLIIADHPAGGHFLQAQDWGLSLTRHEPASETLWFAAPERLQGAAPSTAGDLFTAAASLLYLATGACPARDCATAAEAVGAWRQFDLKGTLADLRPDLEEVVVSWLGWLLQMEPANRPSTARHALEVLQGIVHRGVLVPVAGPQAGASETAAPLLPVHVRPQPPRPVSVPAFRQVPGITFFGFLLRCLVLVLSLAALVALGWFMSPKVRSWLQEWPEMAVSRAAKAGKSPAQKAAPARKADSMKEGEGVMARYIRIAMNEPGVLSLAEVEVFAGRTNLASQGTAEQSTTYSRGPARRAIDGEREGGFTQTLSRDEQPWWEVDLGQGALVTRVVIWNRADKHAGRLKNFTVSAQDASRRTLWQTTVTETPEQGLSLPVDP